jgi:hypothetical protein
MESPGALKETYPFLEAHHVYSNALSPPEFRARPTVSLFSLFRKRFAINFASSLRLPVKHRR